MTGTVRQHAKPLAGLGYLVLLAVLIATSIFAYEKRLPWQDAATITLTTSTPGLELNPHSDVKFQGLRVGEVRTITSDGRSARIEMALDKGKLDLIPANVDAAIVPKTLFGEKYVDLRLPARPSSARLVAGGAIAQSTTSVEISQLFSRLVPVLQALEPAQLSVVLTSLATALDGRGEELARTFNQLQEFLGEVDPHLETFTHDIGQFAKTSEVYARATPDLVKLLDASAGISSELLVPKEKSFAAFLDQVSGTSKDVKQVLATNTVNLIKLSGRSRPVLKVLAEYSSALPCFLEGLHTADILANHAIGGEGPFTKLMIDVIVQNKPYTYPDDLASNPTSDGNNANLPFDVPSWKPHCPEFSSEVLALKDIAPNEQLLDGLTFDPAQQDTSATPSPAAVEEARAALARALAAQQMGVAQDQVPGYAELLVNPLLADGEVEVK